MRLHHRTGPILALLVIAGVLLYAQQGDADRVIPSGGIHVPGWTGKIDAASASQGRGLNDARLAQEGAALHITTGPADPYQPIARPSLRGSDPPISTPVSGSIITA